MRVLFLFFGDVWNVDVNSGGGGVTEERVPERFLFFFCDFGLGM